jgi:hypothetical protein
VGQDSLYTPDRAYASGVLCFGFSHFPIVFCVRKAIFMFVFLKMFVMYVVSFPEYVNVAHLCFFSWSCVLCVLSLLDVFEVFISPLGNELLGRMFWIVCFSSSYASVDSP